MIQNTKNIIIAFLEQVWNQRDVDAISLFVTEDIHLKGSLDIEAIGIAELQSYVQTMVEVFPDFSITIERLIAEENAVAAELTYRGTHQGEIYGIAPTGRVIEYQGAVFFELRGEKIFYAHMIGDMVTMLDTLLLDEFADDDVNNVVM